MFRITYYHSLYKRNVTEITDRVDFLNGAAVWESMGRKQAVPMKILISIETAEG